MIDFPASPTVGQQFTAVCVTWTWDGVKWTASGLNVAYLPLAGGTMLGPIALSADPAAAMQPVTLQYFNARPMIGDNRIINGDMRIDQRNNGVAGTASGYTIDRWQYTSSQANIVTWQGQSSGVFSFPRCLRLASSVYTPTAADFFVVMQTIEADMVSDFVWGSATLAQPVTLSFWVYSNVAGTLSGAIRNAAATRTYPFSFSVPVINTLTKIVVTIPGDTTATAGTWVMSGNAGSVQVIFDLGSGANNRSTAGSWQNGNFLGVTGAGGIVSSGVSIFITGVKLEIGSVATPYNRQSLVKSMADCQRYFIQPGLSFQSLSSGNAGAVVYFPWFAPVTMRATPTIVASWTGLSACTANPFAMANGGANDLRTMMGSVSITTTGMFYGTMNITSLSAEL